MLGTRDDLVRLSVVAALGGLHARRRHDRAEVRVLTSALGDPAPARLVRDIDHRAVDLLDARRGGLHRADAMVVGGDVRIEAAGRGQRDREDRAVPVDRVVGEQDRDVKPRVVNRLMLELVELVGIGEAEDAADRLGGLSVVDLPVGQQRQLVELLVERHLAQQRVDLRIDRLTGRAARLAQRPLVAGAAARGNHPHARRASHPNGGSDHRDRTNEWTHAAPPR